MKYIITFSISLLLLNISWGQPSAVYCQVDKEELLSQLELQRHDIEATGLTSALDRYDRDTGSPFVSLTWSVGSITTKDNVRIQDILLAYDLYTHDLYCKNKNVELILNKRKISQFTMRVRDKDKLFMKLDPIRTHGFAEVLFEDAEILLFKRLSISRKSNSNLSRSDQSYHFSSTPEYFIIQKLNSAAAKKLHLKKKGILSHLSRDRSYKAVDYLKKRGIKIDSIQRCIQMLEATRVMVAQKSRNIIRI